MNLLALIDLNFYLTEENQFTDQQWTNIINLAFQNDDKFSEHVVDFYNILNYDGTDKEDLITDIQHGNGDAFEQFINDIIAYFKQ